MQPLLLAVTRSRFVQQVAQRLISAREGFPTVSPPTLGSGDHAKGPLKLLQGGLGKGQDWITKREGNVKTKKQKGVSSRPPKWVKPSLRLGAHFDFLLFLLPSLQVGFGFSLHMNECCSLFTALSV